MAIAQRRLMWTLDEPVSSAPSGLSSARHAISPVSVWHEST